MAVGALLDIIAHRWHLVCDGHLRHVYHAEGRISACHHPSRCGGGGLSWGYIGRGGAAGGPTFGALESQEDHHSVAERHVYRDGETER